MESETPALAPDRAPPPRRWLVPATLFALAAAIVFWPRSPAAPEAATSRPPARARPSPSASSAAVAPTPGEEEAAVRSMAMRAAEQAIPAPAALGALDFELFVPRSQMDDRFAGLTAKALDLGGKAVPGLPSPNRKTERRLNVSLPPAKVAEFRNFAGAPPLPASPMLSADDTHTLEYFEVIVKPTD